MISIVGVFIFGFLITATATLFPKLVEDKKLYEKVNFVKVYAPYKYAQSDNCKIDLHKVVVYDKNDLDIKSITYDEQLMMSAEV